MKFVVQTFSSGCRPATHFPTSLSVKKIDKTLNFILPLLKFSFTFLFIYINMSGVFQFSTSTTTVTFSSDESSDEDDAKKDVLQPKLKQDRTKTKSKEQLPAEHKLDNSYHTCTAPTAYGVISKFEHSK